MICMTCQRSFDHRASSHQGPECDGCAEEKMSENISGDESSGRTAVRDRGQMGEEREVLVAGTPMLKKPRLGSTPKAPTSEEKQAMKQRVTDEQAREVSASKLKHLSMVSQCALADDLLDARAEIATLRAKLEAVCEAGEVMRCGVICDTSCAAECPRGDCDCDGCDSARGFLAALAAVGEGKK